MDGRENCARKVRMCNLLECVNQSSRATVTGRNDLLIEVGAEVYFNTWLLQSALGLGTKCLYVGFLSKLVRA